jgi:hypothetical protein
VAVPTLALHLATQTGHPAAGPHLALVLLLLVALTSATTTTLSSSHTPAAT